MVVALTSAGPEPAESEATPHIIPPARPARGIRRPAPEPPAPDEFFGPQPTPTELLPDPRPLVENLAFSMIEILAGARDIEQISRWISDDVYRYALKRTVIARRLRASRDDKGLRPVTMIRASRITHPVSGVIEAVVVLDLRRGSRAVAIRLEGMDRRWKATAINVL